jgi:hypothetical protein
MISWTASKRWCSDNPADAVDSSPQWRDRTAEMRVLSDEIKDREAQTLMLKLANDYDKLADRAEDS